MTAPPTTGRSANTRRVGLSELVVPGLLLAIAIFLVIGTIEMKVPSTATFPGPRFFPVIIIGVLVLMSLLVTWQILAHRGEVDETDDIPDLVADLGELDSEDAVDSGTDRKSKVVEVESPATGRTGWPVDTVSDWRTIGLVVGSLLVFAALLVPLGWLISAALLFFGISFALGEGKRPLFDLGVAIVVASVVQVAFSMGLGLHLPPGILEGIF